MSKTNKGSKGPGYDYGSARPVKSARKVGGWHSPGPYTKKLTHRAERRQAVQVVKRELTPEN